MSAVRRFSWLFLRNKTIGTLALVAGAAAILFGMSTWLDLLWVMPAWLLCLFIWQSVQGVHPRRAAIIQRTTPADFGLEAEQVQFVSRDGLKLSAYYVRGTRPEAVLLVHGSGGGGVTMCPYARFLQKAGYHLLMPDLRAHGHSEGNTIDGVQEINDVLAAVEHLSALPGIDAGRIGALGISLGAHTVLHAAAKAAGLRALVLEGLGPVNLEDHGGKPTTLRRKINYPINWLAYRLTDLLAGTRPPSNRSALQGLNRPLLMIASGGKKERYFSNLLFEAAPEPKLLWELKKTRHAAGILQDPKAYADRVLSFFEAYLK